MKKKRKNKNNLPFILIFIVGFLILIYPQISMLYYKIESNNIVEYFDKEKDKLSKEEIEKRIDLAKAYNLSLNNVIDEDPYIENRKKEGKSEYARMLKIKEYIGHIQIPKINEDIPIYAGTSEEVLQKGAGHLEGTSLPIGGNNTHTVITAHTGLPTAKLFTDIDKLQIGDKFYIHNISEVLAYEVDQIKVIEPSNFEDLLVVKAKDYATLLTCTPYMINTHRLLVRGHRIEYIKENVENEVDSYNMKMYIKYFIYISIILILILLFYTLYIRKIKKEKINEKIKNNKKIH